MKAYLWSTSDGNASWAVNGRQRPRQGTKPVSAKIANFLLILLVKTSIPRQIIHECTYCSINNTNELRLLVSMGFWVKKGINGRTNQFEKTLYTGSN